MVAEVVWPPPIERPAIARELALGIARNSFSTNGIKSEVVSFDDMPRGADRSHMYFTYGADDSLEPNGNPTGVWLHVVGNRGTVLVVR